MKRKLEFDSIQFSFGEQNVLNSVYMMVETGSVTGLLGRNGSGKSTLMKIVFGAIAQEQKSVRIDGEPLGMQYLDRKLIGYLPQGNLIPPYLPVRKAFSLFRISELEVTSAFPETADMMHLRPSELSGGYQRIFDLLLVLKSKTMFCLLDEPFSGLTPVFVEKIKALINAARGEKGVIITDHLHKHVMDISDKLYVLANGQTYPVSEPDQLIFFGYLNRL